LITALLGGSEREISAKWPSTRSGLPSPAGDKLLELVAEIKADTIATPRSSRANITDPPCPCAVEWRPGRPLGA